MNGVLVIDKPAGMTSHEELGRKMIMNIVTVGFFGAVSKLIPESALERAVRESVPPATIELNLKAFKRGYEEGQKALQLATV